MDHDSGTEFRVFVSKVEKISTFLKIQQRFCPILMLGIVIASTGCFSRLLRGTNLDRTVSLL